MTLIKILAFLFYRINQLKNYNNLINLLFQEKLYTSGDLKRIYDTTILYLNRFDSFFAYLMDFYEFKNDGLTDEEARSEIYGVASDSLHEVS